MKYFDKDIFRTRMKEVSGDLPGYKIAEIAGVDKTTFSKWLNGTEKAVPNAEHLINISKAFNCSIDYLLGIEPVKEEESFTVEKFLYALVAADDFADFEFEAENFRGTIAIVPKSLFAEKTNFMNIPPNDKELSAHAACHALIHFISNYIKLRGIDLDDMTRRSVIESLIKSAQKKYDDQYRFNREFSDLPPNAEEEHS